VEYLDQLRTLGRRLTDANAGLMAWDRIEAQQRSLSAQSAVADVQPPALSRRALKLQLILLVADMSRLEQEIGMASVLSAN
jgi:hypothetical protein